MKYVAKTVTDHCVGCITCGQAGCLRRMMDTGWRVPVFTEFRSHNGCYEQKRLWGATSVKCAAWAAVGRSVGPERATVVVDVQNYLMRSEQVGLM